MSQRKEVVVLVRQVRTFFSEFDLEALQNVLGAAQNPPPDGEADGSLGEGEYNKARAIERALVELDAALIKPASDYGPVSSPLDE